MLYNRAQVTAEVRAATGVVGDEDAAVTLSGAGAERLKGQHPVAVVCLGVAPLRGQRLRDILQSRFWCATQTVEQRMPSDVAYWSKSTGISPSFLCAAPAMVAGAVGTEV